MQKGLCLSVEDFIDVLESVSGIPLPQLLPSCREAFAAVSIAGQGLVFVEFLEASALVALAALPENSS